MKMEAAEEEMFFVNILTIKEEEPGDLKLMAQKEQEESMIGAMNGFQPK
jgi:hypothetical protein